MPVARCIEDSRSPVWEELTEEQIPASVRERLAKPKPAAAPPKPRPPVQRTSSASGRSKPKVTTRKPPVASPDRLAARERADERLRRAGVSEAIINAVPAPTGNTNRDRADDELRRRNVPESLISAIDKPNGGGRR